MNKEIRIKIPIEVTVQTTGFKTVDEVVLFVIECIENDYQETTYHSSVKLIGNVKIKSE